MTAPRPSDDLEGEREVDLARWRRSLVALWWIPIAGLVVGAIAGVLYSFRGGNTYQASALISLGQPLSPGGSLIPSYGTNPRAVSQITSSAFAQAQAAAKADMRASALRGHVSVAQVGTATGRRDPRDAARVAHGYRLAPEERRGRRERARGHRRQEHHRVLRRRQGAHDPADAQQHRRPA